MNHHSISGRATRLLTVSLTVVIASVALVAVLGLPVATAQDAGTATNEEVARRFFDELHTAGDLSVAEEIIAPDAVFHTPDGDLTGPEGISGLVSVLRSAFPDAEFPIQDLIVPEDTAVIRWTMNGTHTGDFQTIPPSGNEVSMDGIAIMRIEDGLIVEHWVQYDRLGLLQQIGVIPMPQPQATPEAHRGTGDDLAAKDAASNEEVARRFFDELHSGGDLAVADEIIAPDAVFHTPDGDFHGPDGISGFTTVVRTGFPDAELPIEEMVAIGDTVVVRWTMYGTHQGDLQGIPPSGAEVSMNGISILRFEDGLIVEEWVEYDRLSLYQQIGVVATPEAETQADTFEAMSINGVYEDRD